MFITAAKVTRKGNCSRSKSKRKSIEIIGICEIETSFHPSFVYDRRLDDNLTQWIGKMTSVELLASFSVELCPMMVTSTRTDCIDCKTDNSGRPITIKNIGKRSNRKNQNSIFIHQTNTN